LYRKDGLLLTIAIVNSSPTLFMMALHTYSYIVVDTQRGCHTLKLLIYV